VVFLLRKTGGLSLQNWFDLCARNASF
jgi:hypothetical protein